MRFRWEYKGKEPMRYQVQFGGSGRGTTGYIVWDNGSKSVIYGNNTKSECIKVAQRLNEFSPADGREQTYIQQLQAHTDQYGRDIRKLG